MTVRKTIPDLQPGTLYAVRVRAINGTSTSDYTIRQTFTTMLDTIPISVPTSVTWVVIQDSFHGEWNPVTTNTNGDTVSIVRYEVSLVAGATTKIVSVPASDSSSKVVFDLAFAENTSLYGTPQPAITMSVRAVDNHENKSSLSSGILATNAAPAAPTAPVVVGGVDSIDISWTPPADTDLIGYNVYSGASGFTPSSANRVWTGNALRFTFTTTSYVTQFFKIRAVDKFNQESVDLATSGSATSPFILDLTAPSTPTSLAGTITNNANGIGASAVLTWVMTSPPTDLAGYNIRYRPVSTTPYQYMYGIDAAVLTATIQYLASYTNYEFQIQAYDFTSNKSAFSSTLTVTSPSNAAPAVPTSLTSAATDNSITYSWANTDVDIYNYEVTFSTSPTFASGNVTYLTGTAKTLTVSGLTAGTTYYARVRSVDTGGSTSSFTSTDTRATGGVVNTDGIAPGSSPTPTVMARFNGLYVTWTPVTNNDTVTYEVHLSTTTGFTPSGATKVTEVSGSSMLITNLPGTSTALTYGTTYFIKLIAKDKDGAAAAGAQASGVPVKVASSDVTSIGADLIVPGSGFITNLVINSGGSIQSSDYVAATTGFKLNTTGGLEVNTGSVKAALLTAGTLTSSTGVIQIGSGASIVMNGGYLKSNTYTGTTQASNPSGAGFYLGNDGIRIDQGIVSAAAITTGTIGAQTITIGAGGSIVGGGWTLSSSGLSIPAGAITAASLTLQNSPNIVPAPYGSFEVTTNVMFTGVNIIHGPNPNAKFGNTSYSTVMSPTAVNCQLFLGRSQTDYNVVVEAAKTYIVSAYVWVGGTTATPVTMKVKYSDTTTATVNTPTLTTSMTPATSVRAAGTITVPAGVTGLEVYFETGTVTGTAMGFNIDGVQVEEKVGNASTPTAWKPTGMTTMDGAMVKTGSIQSTAVAVDAEGNTISGQLAWAIDTAGVAQFGNVNVRGRIVMGVIGDFASSIDGTGNEVNLTGISQMQSANYNQGQTGWAIRSNGIAEFRQLKADSITAEAIHSVNPDDINGGTITSGLVLATTLTAQDSASLSYTDRTTSTTSVTLTVGAHNRQIGDRVVITSDPVVPSLRAITSNVATLTVPAGHGMISGGTATVSGYTGSDIIFNGTFTLTGATSTTITFALVNANVTSGAGTGTPSIQPLTPYDTPVGSFDSVTGINNTQITYARVGAAIATTNTTGTAQFTGRSTVMDPTGLTLLDNNGTSVVVRLPTTSGTEAFFSGSISASSLIVKNAFSLQGDNNALSAGSTLVLNTSIVAPSAPPTISQSYDSVPVDSTVNTYGLSWDGTFFTTVQNFFGSIAIRYKTTGERLVTSTLPGTTTNDPVAFAPFGGMILIGTSWYLLGSTYFDGTWQVRQFNASWSTNPNTWTFDLHTHAQYNVTNSQWKNGVGGALKDPAIGTDGTFIYIARCDNSGKIKISKFDTTGAIQTAFGSSGVLNTGIVDFQHLRGMQIGSFDLGATRYLVTTEGNSAKSSRTYSHTGSATAPNEYFLSPNGVKTEGITYNGSVFKSFTLNGKIYDHTGLAINGTGSWSAKSSWYDGDNSSLSVTSRSLTSNVAALTVGVSHNYVAGDVVTVSGYTGGDTIFNGTGITLTSVNSTQVFYAVTNANVTSGAGTGVPILTTIQYESPLSTAIAFSVIRRAKLTLTSGTIPDSGRHNDPDRARFYISNDNTNWWRQTPDIASGATTLTISTTPPFSGSSGPTTAFPLGTAAHFVSSSSTTSGSGPRMELNADGWAAFGATADANTLAGNNPALRTGDPGAKHLRIDGDEIIAMTNDTTQGTLVLNQNGQVNVNTLNVITGAINGLSVTGTLAVSGTLTTTTGATINGATGLTTTGANGAITFASLAVGNGNNSATGPMFCRVNNSGVLFSSTTSPSSRDIKHDIAPLELDYRQILKLEPKTFRYNDMPDQLRLGFIAEEAHDLGLGEYGMVGYEDNDDPDKVTGFDYEGFDAALLLVVKKQQEQIDALTARLARLEKN